MPIELDKEQIAAVDKLRTGSILLGGVGSGKSRTALAYYYIKVRKGQLQINGIGRTTVPKKKVPLYIITTAKNRNDGSWEKEAVNFYDVNPIVDSWNNISKYSQIVNAFFIFDEQRVVGKGAWSKNFIKIAKNNDWILLSATPGDVWMDYATVFIANGFYRNITDFNRQHVVFNRFTKYPQVERYVNVEKLEKHRKQILVSLMVTRHTKKHHINVIVPYNTDVFEKVSKERWNVFDNKPLKNASEYCSTLRRIVNSDKRRLNKLDELLHQNRKCIIFYNFNYELDMIIELFQNEDYYNDGVFEYAQWNGHVHESIPKSKRWAYLVQYTAGAEAWNCIETNVIIFYSQNYSYKIMEQASGRIDRRNTPFVDLYYYHLLSKSKIDKGIQRALKNKKRFNEKAYFESRD